MSKSILCLDFDGVLHSYTSPWEGPLHIPDPLVPGAEEFLAEAVKHFRVNVFSSRSHEFGGRDAMALYLKRQGVPEETVDWLEWPRVKPPFLVGLDDRVLTFEGTWPSMDKLLGFKPWNKR